MTPTLIMNPEWSCGNVLCCSSGNVIISTENNASPSNSIGCCEYITNCLCGRASNAISPGITAYERALQQDFGARVSQIALSQINQANNSKEKDISLEEKARIRKEAEEIKNMLPLFEKAFKQDKLYKMVREDAPSSPLPIRKKHAHTTSSSEPLFILKNHKKEAFKKEKIINNLQTIALNASIEKLGEIAEDVEALVRESNEVVDTDYILKLIAKEILFKDVSLKTPPIQFPQEFTSYTKVDDIPPVSIENFLKSKAFLQFSHSKS